MNSIKVSVITVCYNSASSIGATVESVKSQTYDNIEYIVVDGGSTDTSLEIVESIYGSDARVISEPDGGIYDAMNKGLALATGDVIAFLNSDDFYMNTQVIADISECFSKENSLEVLLGGVDFVHSTELDNVVRTYSSSGFKIWMLRFGIMPPHPAMFMRRSVIDKTGFFNIKYMISADFDFMVRALINNSCKFTLFNRPLVRMRTGGVSTQGWKSNMISTREMDQILKDRGIYSNYLLLCLRLPYKYIRQILIKC